MLKRYMLILLLVILLVVTTACKKKEKDLNYGNLVVVPSIIEVDIEDVPDSLDSYVTVKDEKNVINIVVKTNDVNFNNTGDYPIEIIIDYSDNTSKNYQSILRLSYREDLGKPIIIGVKNRLISPTNEEIDHLEGVAFSDDNTIVDSGVIGNVDLKNEGIYTLLYYAEDDEGNYVTESSFVVVDSDLSYLNNFIDTLYELDGTETKWMREYAILYAAIHANTLINQSSIDFFGNFISVDNFEKMLGRTLRSDEANAVYEAQKIFRKNDILTYEDIFNISLTSDEKNSFKVAYELISNYGNSLNINNINKQDYIAHHDIKQYYMNQGTLTDQSEEALDFYHKFTNLAFDSLFFRVLKETDYEIDSRIMEINKENMSNSISFHVSRNGIMNDKNNLLIGYVDQDLLYATLYQDYFTYKTLYEIQLLLEENNVVDMTKDDIYNIYKLIQDAVNSDSYNKNLRTYNILSIEDIKQSLDRELTTIEVKQLTNFIDCYDILFNEPYNELFHIYDGYLSVEDKTEIKNGYILIYSESNYVNARDSLLGITHNIGRQLSDEEIHSLDTIRYYTPRDRYSPYPGGDIMGTNFHHIINLMDNYKIDSNLLHDYLKQFNQGAPYFSPEFKGFAEYANMFDSYYDFDEPMDLSPVRDLINVFLENDTSITVFELFITSNSYELIDEMYMLDFSSSDKQVINLYLNWIQNIVSKKIMLEKSTNTYTYYQTDAYKDAYQTLIDHVYPSIFLLNNDFEFFNKYTYERLTQEEISDELLQALEILQAENDAIEFEKFLSSKAVQIDHITADNKQYYDTLFDMYKFSSIPRSVINFSYYEDLELTIEEKAAFDYFSMSNQKKFNQFYLDNYRYMARYSKQFELIERVDDFAVIIEKYNIKMRNSNGEIDDLLEIVTLEEELNIIHDIQLILAYYDFIRHQGINHNLPGEEIRNHYFAHSFFVQNYIDTDGSITYYNEIMRTYYNLDGIEDLSREEVTYIWNYIDIITANEFNFLLRDYSFAKDHSEEFNTLAKKILKKMVSNDLTMNDDITSIRGTLYPSLSEKEQLTLELIYQYKLDPYAVDILKVGKNYLGYGERDLTLNEVIECMNVVSSIDMHELHNYAPEQYRNYFSFDFYDRLYPEFSVEYYISTLRHLHLANIEEEIDTFNENIYNGTATGEDMINIYLGLQSINYQISGPSHIVYHFDESMSNAVNLDTFTKKITPFLRIKSDLEAFFDGNLIYRHYYSGDIEETMMAYYSNFLLGLGDYEVNEITTNNQGQINYTVEFMSFSIDKYYSNNNIAVYFNRELTNEEITLLDIRNRHIVNAELAGLATDKALSYNEQSIIIELEDFALELFKSNIDVYEFAEDYENLPSYKSLITDEQLEVLIRAINNKKRIEAIYN